MAKICTGTESIQHAWDTRLSSSPLLSLIREPENEATLAWGMACHVYCAHAVASLETARSVWRRNILFMKIHTKIVERGEHMYLHLPIGTYLVYRSQQISNAKAWACSSNCGCAKLGCGWRNKFTWPLTFHYTENDHKCEVGCPVVKNEEAVHSKWRVYRLHYWTDLWSCDWPSSEWTLQQLKTAVAC